MRECGMVILYLVTKNRVSKTQVLEASPLVFFEFTSFSVYQQVFCRGWEWNEANDTWDFMCF